MRRSARPSKPGVPFGQIHSIRAVLATVAGALLGIPLLIAVLAAPEIAFIAALGVLAVGVSKKALSLLKRHAGTATETTEQPLPSQCCPEET